MNRILLGILLATLVTPADAQVRRRVPRIPEPSLWSSLSAGLFNGNDVSDGETNSTWDFGQASTPQFRASFEKAVSSSASVGAVATFAHIPLTYRGVNGDQSCTQCAAHLDAISLGASFHVGGGTGLHQVLEGSAGVLQYRNLKRDAGGSLAPVDGNIDPYFTFGYGFGYAFRRDIQMSVVQDFGLALHERKGLSSEQSNTLRQRTIRLNLRYGFANRVRGR